MATEPENKPITAPLGASGDSDPEWLRNLYPLDNLGRKSLRFLANNFKLLTRKQGDLLFDIGDTRPFTFYLLRGAVKLKDAKGNGVVVESRSDRGRYPLSNLLPRQFRAFIASPQARLARINRDLLEKELAWGQLSRTDAKGRKSDDNEWKLNLLRTPTFARLPMANVQKLFEKLEEVPCKAGEAVIHEGDPGDYYYLIRSGRCKVVRRVGGREIRIGSLGEAEGFGDEALVSDKPRNASVVMESDGTLMRLSKLNFHSLMKAPLLKRVNLSSALSAVDEGKALLIDVRSEEEFAHNRLPHAINIPIFLLYLKTQSMNRGLKYVVYCDTGALSEAAAFLLMRNGFDTYVLDGAPAALAAGEV